jgi:two-component system, sensor histidine kinase and response regulator
MGTMRMAWNSYFSTGNDADLLLQASYNPWLVTLSVLIAAVSSALALSVIEIARITRDPMQQRLALVSGSVALGIGVWAMHFVGMLALRLCAPVSYSLPGTLQSMLPSLFASWVALRLLVNGQLSNRLLIIGGVLVGAGIGSMHYLGMDAMELAPLLRYDPLWFALSIVVAVGLAIVALWVRYSQITASLGTWQRVFLSGAVMGAAIAGMHYSAMKAARFIAE